MNRIILILLSLVSCFSLRAQTVEQLIKEAEKRNDPAYYLDVAFTCNKQNMYDKAFQLITKAVDLGDLNAIYKLGVCYSYGKGTKRDDAKAFSLLTRAAEANHHGAIYMLASHYREGRGCKKNLQKSKELSLKLENWEDPLGYYSLARLYLDEHDSMHATIEWINGTNLQLRQTKANPYIVRDFELQLSYTDMACYLSTKKKQLYHDFICDWYWEMPRVLYGYYGSLLLPYMRSVLNGVDGNIPELSSKGNNTYCLIIGNENYEHVSEVPYAINDSFTFLEYCYLTLGIPEDHIHYANNITLGKMRREVNWLKQNMEASNGKAKVIVYYAGHGIPDERTQTAYLLPVDGSGTNTKTGYSLKSLYSALSSIPSEQVTVFLDACFSGTKRDGDMVSSARGVALKVKKETPKGNLVVFSASQGDETAYPYSEKKHGMFTYYLLKKLQESKGETTLGELNDYITENVRKTSIVNNGKIQTPTAISDANNEWKNKKLK